MNAKYLKKKAPTILSCLSTAGVVVTSVMAVKATPKALELIEKAEKEKGEKLSKWEKVQVAAPKYIPAVLIGATTMVCIFGANILNQHQQASIASAYAFLDQSYRNYRRKVVELYGEETHNEIVNAIAIENAEKVYINASYLGMNCSGYLEEDFSQPILFYDEFSNRYFEKSIEEVMMAEYHLNRNYILACGISVNEFYEFLGLEPMESGDILGWIPEDEGCYWIDFNHRKVELEDGLECYVIEMAWEPSMDYSEYY